MAFNSNPGKQQFSASAGQTVFTFNFAIFANTNIKVYKTLAGAVANDTTDLLTLTTNYTVAINGTVGGTITLLTGASINDTITLARSLPISRATDYVTNGDLYADTLDDDQDYQTYLTADADVQLQRAIIAPESLSGVSLSIPAPIADTYLRWNSTATSLENDATIPQKLIDATAQAGIATTQAGNASASATLAQKWASELENVIVSGGLYSAYHWALKAADSAASFIIDAIPTNGSTNAVSSDGVFDALALKRAKEDTISTMTIVDTTIIPLGNAVSQYIKLSAILGIVSFGTSVTGVKRKIEFVLSTTSITHNATSLILPAGVDILAVAGDVMEVVCTNGALGYWKCISYSVNNISITDSKNYLLKSGGDMTGTIREAYAAIAASDIAVSTAAVFSKTISAPTTFTLSSIPASPKVSGFTLELTNGGSAVVTWWAGIKWTGGTAPTLTAAGLDILEFYTRDGGTTWRGFVSSKDNK